jgi:MFS family permease
VSESIEIVIAELTKARYVIFTTGGTAVGPLIAGYMEQYTGSWRNFVWLSAALAGFNALLLLATFPEPNFRRPTALQTLHTAEEEKGNVSHIEQGKDTKDIVQDIESKPAALLGVQNVAVSNPSWKKILTTTTKVDVEVNLFKTLLHPVVFLTYPPVVWAIFIYGVALSPQIILMFVPHPLPSRHNTI